MLSDRFPWPTDLDAYKVNKPNTFFFLNGWQGRANMVPHIPLLKFWLNKSGTPITTADVKKKKDFTKKMMQKVKPQFFLDNQMFILNMNYVYLNCCTSRSETQFTSKREKSLYSISSQHAVLRKLKAIINQRPTIVWPDAPIRPFPPVFTGGWRPEYMKPAIISPHSWPVWTNCAVCKSTTNNLCKERTFFLWFRPGTRTKNTTPPQCFI